MKRAIIRLSLVIILTQLLSAGCSDFDRRTQFNMTYINRVELDSSNTKPGGKQEVISDTLDVDFEGLVRDHSSTLNSVEGITMVGLSLEIDGKKSPDSASFDFLRSFELHLRGKDMQDILIGKVDSVPRGRVKYFETNVIPDGEDFTDLIKSERFTCRMIYTTYKPVLDSSVVIMITPKYLVDTKKFGV